MQKEKIFTKGCLSWLATFLLIFGQCAAFTLPSVPRLGHDSCGPLAALEPQGQVSRIKCLQQVVFSSGAVGLAGLLRAPLPAEAAIDTAGMKLEKGSLQESGQTYIDRALRFKINYPKDWTVSKRLKLPAAGIIGGTSTTGGGFPSSGTIFVAGNYRTAVTMSVSYTDIRSLLEEAGYFVGSAPINTFQDIGKPRGVADLLVRQRDGNPQVPSPVSTVLEASFSDGPKGDKQHLDFSVSTIIKRQGTGSATTADEISKIDTAKRKTLAKSYLAGNGILLTAWASAIDSEWQEKGGAVSEVVDSFEVSDIYALQGLMK